MIEFMVSDASTDNMPFGMYCLRCLLMLPSYWPERTGYQSTILNRYVFQLLGSINSLCKNHPCNLSRSITGQYRWSGEAAGLFWSYK